MRLRVAIAAVTALTVLAHGAEAQRGGGTGSRYVLAPPLFDFEEGQLRVPLSEADEAYAAIESRTLKRYLDEVTAFSRESRESGNQYWGRIAGTEADRRTARWVEERFRTFGLENV